MGVRVLTVIGTRPEAIKLFPLIHALEADPRFESRVCVTGQHREMVDEVLAMARIAPAYDLAIMEPGQTLDAIVARVLRGLEPILAHENPDWVVVQGDTSSAVASSLSAYHRRLRICHVEAGLRSGDMNAPWPEEANRRMIGVMAALHCAPTALAREHLLAEGVAASAVHVTGNTGADATLWVHSAIAEGRLATPVADTILARIGGRPFMMATTHRRETAVRSPEAIARAIEGIAARGDIVALIILHPNPLMARPLLTRLAGREGVILHPAVPYPDMVRLMVACRFLLTDSGGLQEEGPTLGKPVLIARDTTERQEAIDAGSAILATTKPSAIVGHARRLIEDTGLYKAMAVPRQPFGDGDAALKILRLLGEQPSGGVDAASGGSAALRL